MRFILVVSLVALVTPATAHPAKAQLAGISRVSFTPLQQRYIDKLRAMSPQDIRRRYDRTTLCSAYFAKFKSSQQSANSSILYRFDSGIREAMAERAIAAAFLDIPNAQMARDGKAAVDHVYSRPIRSEVAGCLAEYGIS